MCVFRGRLTWWTSTADRIAGTAHTIWLCANALLMREREESSGSRKGLERKRERERGRERERERGRWGERKDHKKNERHSPCLWTARKLASYEATTALITYVKKTERRLRYEERRIIREEG
jgi:hypothetical protein